MIKYGMKEVFVKEEHDFDNQVKKIIENLEPIIGTSSPDKIQRQMLVLGRDFRHKFIGHGVLTPTTGSLLADMVLQASQKNSPDSAGIKLKEYETMAGIDHEVAQKIFIAKYKDVLEGTSSNNNDGQVKIGEILARRIFYEN